MSDKDLINKLKCGDPRALYEMIVKYSNLIYGVSKSVLSDSHEEKYIDDCFNDVLTIIWYNSHKFNFNVGSFKNWIISITRNKAIDYKRISNKRYSEIELDDKHIDNQENIESIYIEKEKKQILAEAIGTLIGLDKEIFKMRFIDGRDISDIGDELGISRGCIYTRISRGKEKLKSIMEEYNE